MVKIADIEAYIIRRACLIFFIQFEKFIAVTSFKSKSKQPKMPDLYYSASKHESIPSSDIFIIKINFVINSFAALSLRYDGRKSSRSGIESEEDQH